MAAVPIKATGNESDEWTKPPFLRRVRIRGYKSIDFCDVSLQPLTILVGRNAAGKSNFLDALAFLRDVMKVGVAEAVKIKPRGGWSSLRCRSSDSPKIEIEVEVVYSCGRPSRRIKDNNGPSISLLPNTGPLPDLTDIIFTAIYTLEFTAEPRSAPIISKESLEINNEEKNLTTAFEVNDGIVERWAMHPDYSAPLSQPQAKEFFSVHRPDFPLLAKIGTQPFVELGEGLRSMTFYNFIPDAMRGKPTPTAGALLEKHGENLPSVIEGLKELEPESVERVRDYLRVIAPEIEDFNITRPEEYETIRFRLLAEHAEKKLEFNAASMSDGTLRALAALMAVFQIVLPHGHPSVVGIEEPETALHPAAMRALVDAMDDATQRTQVILTTHSAELLSGRDVLPGQVLVVRNRGGRTNITPVDKASREIIEKELYTLADLQRMDKLDIDEADVKRQTELSQERGT